MNIHDATEQAYKRGYEAGQPKWIPVTECWDEWVERNPPMTNADRIRAMSDEEIAQWLCLNYSCTKCPGQNLCTITDGKHNGLTKWLKQPAETEKEC